MENEKIETESLTPSQMLLNDLDAEEQSDVTNDVMNDVPNNETEVEKSVVENEPIKNGIPSKEEILNELANNVPTEQEQPSSDVEEALPMFNSEEFMDEFYDNPAGAVEKAANVIAEKKVKEVVAGIEARLKPLLSQSEAAQVKAEVKDIIQDFVNENSDAKDMFPDIAGYIKMNGLNPKDKRSYVDAMREVKIGRLGKENEELRANQGKNLDFYLSDNDSMDKIVSNDAVAKRVIENYLKDIQKGGKPATIGNGSTNQFSAQGADRPQTLKDAAALLRSDLTK